MNVINPYNDRGLIRNPEKFFGRKRELREVFNRLATMQSVSIVGERRIGKSSFLNRIAHPQSDELTGSFTLRYLDLQRVFSAQEFYARACKELDRERGDTHLDLEEAIEGKQVILCLDEFEQAYTEDFGSEFFNALRSLAQTGNLALVVATQSPLNELHRDYLRDDDVTSKFHNIFSLLKLGEFTLGEAQEMVAAPRNGHRFNDDEVNRILKLAGTHPYWLNRACAEAYAARQVGPVNFGEIKLKLDEEHQAAQADQPNAVPGAWANQASFAGRSAQPPNATMRLAVILGLIALALGTFSANASFAPGMFVALCLLLVGLFLLFKPLPDAEGRNE